MLHSLVVLTHRFCCTPSGIPCRALRLFSYNNLISTLSITTLVLIAHLIAGGAPAGIKIPTPDFGCLTNNTNINTTTIHGNNSTTPNGIDMLELPFNLSGFLKNANLPFDACFRLGFDV
jgi:hypothetical protein